MTKLKIEVFTSPTCPHCPSAVNATKKILDDNPELKDKVNWKKLDTSTNEGRKKAQEYEIRGVPTIILTNQDGEKGAVTGTPSQKKYLDIIYEMLGEEKPKIEIAEKQTKNKKPSGEN